MKIKKILRFIFLWGEWETSALANWTVIPIASAILLAILNQHSYSDMMNYTNNKVKNVRGHIVFVGLRQRSFYISTANSKIYMMCDPIGRDHGDCLPREIRPIRDEAIVKYFRYEGEGSDVNIILEAVTPDGKTILSRQKALRGLKGATEVAQGDTWAFKAIIGFVFGIIISIFRQTISIPMNKRRIRKEKLNSCRENEAIDVSK